MIFQLTFIVAFCLFQEESSTCPNDVKNMVLLISNLFKLFDKNFRSKGFFCYINASIGINQVIAYGVALALNVI